MGGQDWSVRNVDLDQALDELYDLAESRAESQSASEQTTNTDTDSTPALSNCDLLLSLVAPTPASKDVAIINNASYSFSDKSLSPQIQQIKTTKLPQWAFNAKHVEIMALYQSPSSIVEPQTPPTTPEPLFPHLPFSVPVPLVAIKEEDDPPHWRVRIRQALQAKNPKALPPQHGWASDGAPQGSVWLSAENFAKSYDQPDENNMVPKETFKQRTKGIFHLRAATVHGCGESYFMWLEFAPKHVALKKDWFWMQVWRQSSEFLPFLRDRQHKGEDGRWVMYAVDEEWDEWKKIMDRSGRVVLLDLTAKALNAHWKLDYRSYKTLRGGGNL